jgi:DNA-binding LacI/PurR family transcriptional regulator
VNRYASRTGRTRRDGARRTTLADVARAAGVSASTASLAVNGTGPVAPATRERVLAAARELGYCGPDPLARSLRRGRCGVVAVVLYERLAYAFSDPMMVSMLDGLADEVEAVGSSLLLVPVPHSDGALEKLASLPMDAAVLDDCDALVSDLVPALRDRGVAVVRVDGPRHGEVPVVDLDEETATDELFTHLAELGHTRFGVITLPLATVRHGGPLDLTSPEGRRRLETAARVQQRRTRAAAASVERLGASVRFVEAARNLVDEGERAAGTLLDRLSSGGDVPTTAIVAQSDVLALGCLRAAAARRLRVPDDLSVTGFDGVDLHLPDGTTLTTIEQPSTEKGRVAGRLVLACLAGDRPEDVRLPTRFRVGTTSGPGPGYERPARARTP